MKLHKYLPALVFGLLPFNYLMASDELVIQNINENIYAIVGETGNRSPANLGNNATFGVVVTSDGIVLIDSGGTYQGAQKLHQVIKSITDKPVVTVINTGGQDHRWLGNGYFKALGAEIIASKKAVEDQKNRKQDQFFRLGMTVGDKGIEGTEPVYADKTFDEDLQFTSGKTNFEIHHRGQAHTPGDSFIWLPQHKVMFSGDIVYTERMLGIMDHSNSKSWMSAFEAMASYKPDHLFPGHGQPTTLEKASSDTYDYLKFLRQSVTEFMDNGGDISDISKVDQSQFKYLLNFDTLSGRNAQRVFSELEWE